MIKRIRLGLSDLPGYGKHPGTSVLAILVLVTGTAGLGYGIKSVLFAMSVALICYGPLYLIGAWGRGNDYLKDLKKKNMEEHTNDSST